MRAPRTVRGIAALVAALVVGIVFSAGAQAAPGDLDLMFSGDGRQRSEFGLRDSARRRRPRASRMARSLVAGGTYEDFALARYNTDGTLDTSFAGDGTQSTEFTPGQTFGVDERRAVAIQADGKISQSASPTRSIAPRVPSPATTPTGRWTRLLGDGKQTGDFGPRRSGDDPGRRQDRRGRERRRRRLRARALQPGRVARHELLGRRQADD